MPELRVQARFTGFPHGILELRDGGGVAWVGGHIGPGQVGPEPPDAEGAVQFSLAGGGDEFRPIFLACTAAAQSAVQFKMYDGGAANAVCDTGQNLELRDASKGNINVVLECFKNGGTCLGCQIQPREDGRRDACLAEGDCFAELGGSQPIRPRLYCGSGHFHQAVAVSISLHHGHEVRSLSALFQGCDIV